MAIIKATQGLLHPDLAGVAPAFSAPDDWTDRSDRKSTRLSLRESSLDPAKKRNFDSSRFNLFGGCPSPEALVEPKVLVGSLLSLLFHDLRI